MNNIGKFWHVIEPAVLSVECPVSGMSRWSLGADTSSNIHHHHHHCSIHDLKMHGLIPYPSLCSLLFLAAAFDGL